MVAEGRSTVVPLEVVPSAKLEELSRRHEENVERNVVLWFNPWLSFCIFLIFV